jgi:predicted nucleotidyltransferase
MLKFDSKKALRWLKELSTVLPGVDASLAAASSDVFVIGAAVFDVYCQQGWIPPLKRKTGDLDLSVGLVHGEADYERLKAELLTHDFNNSDPQRPYRFFPPKAIPGAFAYVDLLAHPAAAEISATRAQNVMGAGPEFSFAGMELGTIHALSIAPRVYCPNPIGLTALKLASYHDDPTKRVKDLADVAELAFGLVGQATHYDLNEIWAKIRNRADAKKVKSTLLELAGGESSAWDLDEARRELLDRGFSESEIAERIPLCLKEWATSLE